MTAAAVVPMIGVAGGAIDASRMYLTRSRLQAACDSAVLAGRKAMTSSTFDQASRDRANAMFNFNFQNADFQTTGTTFTPSADANGKLSATASTTIPMTLMKVFGFSSRTASVNCSADIQIPNIDIVFVLDVTGSMASRIGSTSTTRIDGMKTAAKNFYNTLQTQLAANGANAGRVRYGFVPYDQAVNVEDLFKASPDTTKGEAPLSNLVDSMVVESRVANFDASSSGSYIRDTSVSITTYDQTFDDDDSDTKKPYVSDTNDSTDLNESDCSAYAQNADFTIGSGRNANSVDLSPDGTILYIPEGSNTAQRSVPTTNKYVSITFSRVTPRIDKKDEDPCTRQVTRTPYVKVPVYTFKNWTYKPITVNVASFKAGGTITYVTDVDEDYTVTSATSLDPIQLANLPNQWGLDRSTTTWNGCIEERDTTAASTFTPIPGTANDLNFLAGGTSDPFRWRPVLHRLTYNRGQPAWETTKSDLPRPDTGCPSKSITNLNVMTQTEFNNYIDSLSPGGKTYLDIGMIWGLRLISPQGMWGSRNLIGPNGGQISRHIIFLTDGDPVSDGTTYSAYGVENTARRITGTTGVSAATLHARRFQALCDAQRGTVAIWAIALDTSVDSNLSACADPGRAYEANNAAALNNAFNAIANDISDLRLVQ